MKSILYAVSANAISWFIIYLFFQYMGWWQPLLKALMGATK